MRLFLFQLMILAMLIGLNVTAGGTASLAPVPNPSSLQSLVGSTYAYFKIEKIQSFKVTNSAKTIKNIDLYLAIQQGSPWLQGESPVKEL